MPPQTTSYPIEAAAAAHGASGGAGVPLMIVCDLAQRHGRKVLTVSSMVTVRNCTSILAEAALLSPDGRFEPIGELPPGGTVAVPLRAARDGTVCVRPLVAGLEFGWSNPESEGVRLRAVHDGTLRLTQLVDARFQRIFGARLGGGATLVAAYACANDVEGVLRQVRRPAHVALGLCAQQLPGFVVVVIARFALSPAGCSVRDGRGAVPLLEHNRRGGEGCHPARACHLARKGRPPPRVLWSLRAWVSDRHHSPQLPQHVRRKMAVK